MCVVKRWSFLPEITVMKHHSPHFITKSSPLHLMPKSALHTAWLRFKLLSCWKKTTKPWGLQQLSRTVTRHSCMFLVVPKACSTDGNWGLLESSLFGTSVVILVNLECFPSWGKCWAGISICLIYGQFQVKCQKTTPQIWVTLERVGCTGECTGEQRGAEWVIGIVEMVLSVYAKQSRT